MSITALSPDPDTMFNKTFRRRNDSDDLDVFEASRYFSGEPTATGDEKQSTIDYWNRAAAGGGRGVRRLSLDMPTTRTHNHHHTAADQKQIFKDNKKHKQPSSPGGRLASFLNSLFSQSKKKPKSTDHDRGLEDRHGGGGRRRRSSISHFATTHTNPNQSSPIYFLSSKKPGPRSPPVQTGSDHTETVALSVPNKLVFDPSEVHYEKFRLRDDRNNNFTTTVARINKPGNLDRSKPVFEDIDDGAESDSSSDLFELRNYDLGCYSSGLPVYETAHMNKVKNLSIQVNSNFGEPQFG